MSGGALPDYKLRFADIRKRHIQTVIDNCPLSVIPIADKIMPFIEEFYNPANEYLLALDGHHINWQRGHPVEKFCTLPPRAQTNGEELNWRNGAENGDNIIALPVKIFNRRLRTKAAF